MGFLLARRTPWIGFGLIILLWLGLTHFMIPHPPFSYQVAKAQESLEAGAWSAAESRLLELKKNHPQEFLPNFLLGALYLETKDYENSARHLDAALRLKPNHPEALMLQIHRALQQAQWSRAETYWQELKSAHPQDPRLSDLATLIQTAREPLSH